jgi:hypothetical protein
MLPGTYSIEICRGPCGGAAADSVLARGHLVLEAEYPLSEVPQPARGYLEDDIYMRVRDDSILDPNACFVFTRVRESGGYAGLARVGVTRAELHGGDTLAVDLFHSPDAGYYAILQIKRGELRGRGHSWGFGITGGEPVDSIRARRIGPPDRSLCIRAAEVEAEALRHPPRP